MNPERQEDKGRIAEVTGVVRSSSPYAFAKVEGIDGDVTFSLSSRLNVWREDSWPARSMSVVLFDLRKVGEKWRAYKARFFRPEDESSIERKRSGQVIS